MIVLEESWYLRVVGGGRGEGEGGGGGGGWGRCLYGLALLVFKAKLRLGIHYSRLHIC